MTCSDWLHSDTRIGSTEAEACFSNQDGTGSSGQYLEGALARHLAAFTTVAVLNTDSDIDEMERRSLMAGGPWLCIQ